MIRGIAKKDRRTKDLIARLSQGDIAVIHHQDLDEVAAIHLVEKKIRAVINGGMSISGKYPNQGPKILCDAGILIVDNVGTEIFDRIEENLLVEISGDALFQDGLQLCPVHILCRDEVLSEMEGAAANLKDVLHDFIENTLDYAAREKDLIIGPMNLPKISGKIRGRHVLVVIRGKNYKEDLKAIRPYIEEMNPIMIGVDGGGDALLDYGLKPDILMGDMDSVSDHCLQVSKEIIVHAYTDGRCPGMDRIKNLGLKAISFPYPGTSEDIALLLAYEHQAELIVTVGSHTSMIDFLEKGRRGMASTFLVRMKVGDRVIDAKGVHEFYKNRLRPGYLAVLMASALFPIAMVARMSPQIQELYRLIALRIRILVGI